jgi:hypothetical protein
MFGLDVTVWSPPHLFAVGAAGAIRMGGVVALAGEMSHAGHVMPPRQRSWDAISLAEGVLLVLFSPLLGNLTFMLGGYEYWATPQDGVAYTVMASWWYRSCSWPASIASAAWGPPRASCCSSCSGKN